MASWVQRLMSADRDEQVEALRSLIARAGEGNESARQALRVVVADYRRFDTEIYTRALNDLDVFADRSLADALLAALADDEYGCQAWTATACVSIGLIAAEPRLRELLDHHDTLVRESACAALGALLGEAAVPTLAGRLDDPSEFVRAAAAQALASIGGEAALAALWAALRTRTFPRRGYLAAALARFRPSVIDRLIALAHDEDPDLRYWAARALGAAGNQRATVTLQYLIDNDQGVTTFGARVATAAKRGLKTFHRLQARQAEPELGSETPVTGEHHHPESEHRP